MRASKGCNDHQRLPSCSTIIGSATQACHLSARWRSCQRQARCTRASRSASQRRAQWHELTWFGLQYAAGAGLVGSTLAATGLYIFQCRLIYPSYVPEGSRKSELMCLRCVMNQLYFVPCRNPADHLFSCSDTKRRCARVRRCEDDHI